MPVLISPFTGTLVNHFGARAILSTALALQAIGIVLLALALSEQVTYSEVVPGLVFAGVGMGLFFAPITRTALTTAAERYSGIVSGVASSMRQSGTVLGIAVLSAVFSSAGSMTSFAAFVDGASRDLRRRSPPRSQLRFHVVDSAYPGPRTGCCGRRPVRGRVG
ncbi:MFS family permease [Rhodococcus sp. 27YEA15]|uniref:hypothetical protein n=1 Tax=Rhodococcus sp. 27YEA15 TaxID=3156259 RepID=UPI003C7C7C0B